MPRRSADKGDVRGSAPIVREVIACPADRDTIELVLWSS